MKKCPYCGHINDDDRWNCSRCYAGLPEEKKPEEKTDKEPEHENAPRKRIRS